MVTDPRTSARTGAIKPLNAPQAVQVREENGVPAAVRIEPQVSNPVARRSRRRRAPSPQPSPAEGRGRNAEATGRSPLRSDGVWVGVSDIEDVWKISDEWWRGPGEEIERAYFSLLLENDQRVTLFQDMTRHEWYRQAD